MKYTRYKRLITYLAKFLAFVKRYKIAIMSVCLGITAVTSALLGLNGMVIGEDTCPSSVVYGQEIEIEASAFMADLKYQYYDVKSGK